MPPMQMQARSMGVTNTAASLEGSDMYHSDDDEDDEEEAPGFGLGESAKVNQGDSIATGFTIPRKVSIESNNRPSKVVIAELDFSPTMVYYAVPSTGDQSVYLQAKVINNTEYTLLGSKKVNIFVDGAFISTSSLRQTFAGSNFHMFLGVDPSVKCTYREIKSENKGATWTNSNKSRERSFSTVITNNKSTNITVLVADVLPKAEDEKIVVETIDPKPSAIKILENGGGVGIAGLGITNITTDGIFKDEGSSTITWVNKLAMGEKKSINYHYSVSYPQSFNLELHKEVPDQA